MIIVAEDKKIMVWLMSSNVNTLKIIPLANPSNVVWNRYIMYELDERVISVPMLFACSSIAFETAIVEAIPKREMIMHGFANHPSACVNLPNA